MSPADATTTAVLIAVVSGVLGLLIGSFLNVVVYRVPLSMSLVAPPSACPKCGSGIAPRDNVPVLSWLLLRGRCRNCAERISARYPIVEAGTALFFVLVSLRFAADVASASFAFGVTDLVADLAALAAFLYFAAISLALAIIDVEKHRLPNSIVLPGYPVAFVLLGVSSIFAADAESFIRAAIGSAGLFLFYFVISLISPAGMGFGDVKLAGVIGAFLGWIGWGALAVGAFAAFLLGGLFAIVLVLARLARRKSGIPFGPWMLAGAWVGIFFGNPIWSGYLSFVGLTAS